MTQTSHQPIGERYQPFSPKHMQDPYSFYAQARKEEPIFFSPQLDAYVVTRMKDVRAILENAEAFSSGNIFRPLGPFYPQTLHEFNNGYPPTPILLNADGALHSRQRKPMNKLLAASQVKLMEPMIWAKAHALVDTFINDKQVELMSCFARRLPLEVICDVLGIGPSYVEEIGIKSEALLTMISAQDEHTQALGARHMVELHKLCAQLVLQRRAEPQEDMISKIIASFAPGDAPLTKEQEGELAQFISGLILAAHETTSSAIGEGIKLLLSNPDQWQLLCQQPDLVATVVEEIVRFLSPAHAFFRVATREVVVGDETDGTQLTLPAGTQFLLLYGSANHDEAVCPHAEQFDPQRPLKSNQHVGFGHGTHFCVGVHLAHKEVEIGLLVLTQRLPHMRLTPEQTFEYRKVLMSRGLRQLLVEW